MSLARHTLALKSTTLNERVNNCSTPLHPSSQSTLQSSQQHYNSQLDTCSGQVNSAATSQSTALQQATQQHCTINSTPLQPSSQPTLQYSTQHIQPSSQSTLRSNQQHCNNQVDTCINPISSTAILESALLQQ
jgi:hypothetical protein